MRDRRRGAGGRDRAPRRRRPDRGDASPRAASPGAAAPVRFDAALGRAGCDGAAPLDLGLALPGASAAARGVLVAEGGFEGTDRGLRPRPRRAAAAPARAPSAPRGRLTATADLIAGRRPRASTSAGAPARGAVALPPRAGAAARHRADRGRGSTSMPGSRRCARGRGAAAGRSALDLSAEAAALRAGMTLRRLRGAAFLRGRAADAVRRLGAAAGRDAARARRRHARAAGSSSRRASPAPNLRATLAALGLPVERARPGAAAPRRGPLRLVLRGRRRSRCRTSPRARRRAAVAARACCATARGRRSGSG